MKHVIKAAAFFSAVVFSSVVHAENCKAVQGVTEHPALPLYEGACPIGSQVKAFDQYTISLGPALKNASGWTSENVASLEGARTTLLYTTPAQRSPLEVFRNYEQGLKERGYTVLYQCAKEACGRSNTLLNNVVYAPPLRSEMRSGNGGDAAYYAFNGGKESYYLAAQSADQKTWIALMVGQHGNLIKAMQGLGIVLAEVVEVRKMESRMIDAKAMASAIGDTGRIALRNIYFDFAKATLTAESRPALEQIGELLTQNPQLSLYVVGHTDNVGSDDTNMTLSRQRAEAVVAALESQYGVAKGRLIPAGVGALAPVASNRTEAGRAENRRVELVERK